MTQEQRAALLNDGWVGEGLGLPDGDFDEQRLRESEVAPWRTGVPVQGFLQLTQVVPRQAEVCWLGGPELSHMPTCCSPQSSLRWRLDRLQCLFYIRSKVLLQSLEKQLDT